MKRCLTVAKRELDTRVLSTFPACEARAEGEKWVITEPNSRLTTLVESHVKLDGAASAKVEARNSYLVDVHEKNIIASVGSP